MALQDNSESWLPAGYKDAVRCERGVWGVAAGRYSCSCTTRIAQVWGGIRERVRVMGLVGARLRANLHLHDAVRNGIKTRCR